MAKAKIGSKVKLTHRDSVAHFRIADMSITGEIVGIDEQDELGRNYKIKFDDRAGEWEYAKSEFKVISQTSSVSTGNNRSGTDETG